MNSIKMVLTYIDTRGRLRTKINTMSAEDFQRVVDMIDEVSE